MSSVYKKGRDGYYYYQTYVYNPESKKKDKRVFHALRTKDKSKAKIKQHELDLQYEKQSMNDSAGKNISYNLINIRSVSIIFAAIITVIFLFIMLGKDDQLNVPNNINYLDTNPNMLSDNQPVKSKINYSDSLFIDGNSEIVETFYQIDDESTKEIIPEYSIERIDELSDAFKQVKLHVTLSAQSSDMSQKLLCQNLTKQFNEFSNIVICLYTNNRVGTALANGIKETINLEERKKSWLAMYTYNSVEGEYFDNNPGSYLSVY